MYVYRPKTLKTKPLRTMKFSLLYINIHDEYTYQYKYMYMLILI